MGFVFFFSMRFRHPNTSKKEKRSVCQGFTLLHLKHLYKIHLRRNLRYLTLHFAEQSEGLAGACSHGLNSVRLSPLFIRADRSQLGDSCPDERPRFGGGRRRSRRSAWPRRDPVSCFPTLKETPVSGQG